MSERSYHGATSRSIILRMTQDVMATCTTDPLFNRPLIRLLDWLQISVCVDKKLHHVPVHIVNYSRLEQTNHCSTLSDGTFACQVDKTATVPRLRHRPQGHWRYWVLISVLALTAQAMSPASRTQCRKAGGTGISSQYRL